MSAILNLVLTGGQDATTCGGCALGIVSGRAFLV